MASPGPVFPEDLFHYAVIITDMWDSHVCPPARRRVEQLVARVADVIGNARRRGALIVHAPSGYSQFYEHSGSAARQRALAAPHATLPTSPAPVYPSRDQEPIVVDENQDGACDEARDWSKSPTRQHGAIGVD